MSGKARILVVEDEGITALDISQRLSDLGYDVVATAATGPAAIEKAASLEPDLVLMDIHLKGDMDGITAAEEIGRAHDVPIVFLTAYADEETLERAKITEPYGYVLKPVDMRELDITLEFALYRHRADRQVAASTRWLDLILRSVTDGVIATDDQGRITYFNATAGELTGWTADAALQHDVARVFRLTDHGVHPVAQVLAQAVAAIGPKEATLIAGDAEDAATRAIEYSCSPIHENRQRQVGALLVFRDISERKQAEARLHAQADNLRAALRELEELDRLKGEFAQNVSHELRTPLALVLGYTEMLAAGEFGPLQPEQAVPLDVVLRRARELNRLVEDITLLLETERLSLAHACVNPAPILQAVVAEYTSRAHSAGLTLYSFIEPELPPVKAHQVHLHRVVSNLVSNALKFTSSGGTVALKGRRVDGHVVVEVEDTGAGIPPEELQRIFHWFYQVDGSSTRRHGGTGVGLAVVKQTVEALGGDVAVDSVVGQGSRFVVRFPISEPDVPMEQGIWNTGY